MRRKPPSSWAEAARCAADRNPFGGGAGTPRTARTHPPRELTQCYFGAQDRDGIAAASFWQQTGFRRTFVDARRPLGLARRASKQPGHFFLERNDAVLRRTVRRNLQY